MKAIHKNNISGKPLTRRSFAKIDPPRISDIYARERLFERLDGYRDRGLIWLAAPPGYGKTVVVASWLQARAANVIWYQCDDGDADTASFFYFLTEACLAQDSPGKPGTLPTLSPELYPALPTLVRNYFREFCARLPIPAVVVFDNWQEIPAGAPLRELLPIAVSELPQGVSFVVVSREAPAANLSRLQVTGAMVTLGVDDLQLTKQETAEIAACHAASPDTASELAVEELYELTRGWAAGVTALSRLQGRRPSHPFDTRQAAIQTVFNYMTSEVLERQSDTVKDFLLKTSCLESVTVPIATQLTGNADAGGILDSLVRRNAFTLQSSTSGAYRYHPLFKELLRTRAVARFSAAEHEEILTAAARILAAHQDTEGAIDLLLEARRWPEASLLMTGTAPLLVEQGRFQTLSAWIDALPADVHSASSWLTYWRGIACLATDLPVALPMLERAHTLFVDAADPVGQMLAIAAILQHHHVSFTKFGPMIPWIEALLRLMDSEPRFPSPSVELGVVAGLFSAIVLADPGNPRLIPCRDRVLELMHADVDQRSRAAATATLFNYFAICGDLVQWRSLLPETDWINQDTQQSPALRIQLLWMLAYRFQLTGELDRCHTILDAASRIAQEHGLPAFDSRILLSKLQATDFASNEAALAAQFAQLEPQFADGTPLMTSHFHYVYAMFHFARGDLQSALREITLSELITRESGYAMAMFLVLVGMGEILCELERVEDAAARLLQIDAMAAFPSPLIEFNAGLLRAEVARRQGRQGQFLQHLARVLAVGREQGFGNGFHAYPVLLPRLTPYALEHGIEVEYCRWLIRTRHFAPPDRHVPSWPWPIRILSLGRFQVQVGERPLEIPGKTQRRPLNLLKALLASRAGVEVDVLIDRFWPDLEGDAARNAFDLAVHRLRKLLGHRNAVIVTQGRLALDRNVVWADTFALEALGTVAAFDGTARLTFETLLELYRGPFLADQSESWIFAARERWRSTFLRCVARLSTALHRTQDLDALADFLQRVLEIEPSAEEVYRGLMSCLIAQGRHAEAIRVYHRCSHSLSTLLHAQPSPPTQKLYESLTKR